MQVELWICPTEGCGNYYGASSARGKDLSTMMNYKLTDGSVPTHSRAVCPDCKARGVMVERVCHTVVVASAG